MSQNQCTECNVHTPLLYNNKCMKCNPANFKDPESGSLVHLAMNLLYFQDDYQLYNEFMQYFTSLIIVHKARAMRLKDKEAGRFYFTGRIIVELSVCLGIDKDKIINEVFK